MLIFLDEFCFKVSAVIGNDRCPLIFFPSFRIILPDMGAAGFFPFQRAGEHCLGQDQDALQAVALVWRNLTVKNQLVADGEIKVHAVQTA